jgi:uncharacterized protein (DUF1800 family)
MSRRAKSSLRRRVHAAIVERYGVPFSQLRFQRPLRVADPEALDVPVPSVAAAAATTAAAQATKPAPGKADGSRPELFTLARPPFAVRVLNHLTYGATAESIAAFNALGGNDDARLTAFVDRQLDPASIDDSAVEARLTAAGYTTLNKTLTQLWLEHRENSDFTIRSRPGREAPRAALVRAVFSQRQLFEVLTDFWHNHFNVQVSNSDSSPVFIHYTRDVIRANALGNFRRMLEDVAQSTAMLYYLDNATNTRSGPNENYARELLELHTFGAENYLGFVDPFSVPPCPEDPSFPIGYSDLDVYDTAAAFTGWTVKDGRNGPEDDGGFIYRQSLHDAGPKLVLGRYIFPEQPAMKDGRDILDRIAQHPRVAKYVCKKLIRRFISDRPDQALIDSAAAIFRANWQSPDQIKLTLRHILLSDALKHSWGMKHRRPYELLVAAMRVGGTDWTLKPDDSRSNDLMSRLASTGHSPYDWAAPNGYPDTGVAWSGSNSMAMSWKLLNWLTETTDNTVPLLPILAATRSGVSNWTANNLVDFWCQRLLGYVPAARRQQLVGFMAQNGDPATYVITDTDSSASSDLKRHYNQQRLRSLVSLILLSPEFISR